MTQTTEEVLEQTMKAVREIDNRLRLLSTKDSLALLRRIKDWCQSRIDASLPKETPDRARRDYRRRR